MPNTEAPRTPAGDPGCLGDAELERIATGGIAVDVGFAARVETHLDGCGACRRAVSALLRLATAGEPSVDGGHADPDVGESPRAGDRIHRYVLERWLGRGGMGTVWQARDPRLGRSVAIKMLRDDLRTRGPDADARRATRLSRLVREARAMAALAHPHVVAVFDVGVQTDRDGARAGVYIVMELLEGPTLAQWLAPAQSGGTAPSTEAILDAFVQAGEGLAAAHDAGLVHRDFKPANVLFGADGRVRVCDFGLVRSAASAGDAEVTLAVDVRRHDDSAVSPTTRTGYVVGTPHYMAPEQMDGGAGDARSDQYAFCVALYEALAGVRPFAGTAAALHLAKNEGRVAPPRRRVSRALLDVVMRGLSPTPDDRWPSVRELVAVLRRRRRGRRRLVPAVLSLVMGGVSLGALARTDGSECDELRRLDAAWDDLARTRLRQAVADATGVAQAASTVDALDEQAERIRGDVVGHCAVDREAPLDRCLRDVTTQFVVTVAALTDDPRAAARATTAITGLRERGRCQPGDAVESADPRLSAIDDRIAIARALWDVGLPNDALQAATQAEADSKALGDAGRGKAAMLRLEIADMHLAMQDLALARQGFADAYYESAALHADTDATLAAISRAVIDAEARVPEQAERWARFAEASRARAPLAPCAEVRFQRGMAMVTALRGALEAAVPQLEAVVDTCPDDCRDECIRAVSALGAVLSHAGRFEDALGLRQRALAEHAAQDGPDALATAGYRLNLANALFSVGAYAESERELDRAARVFETHVGPEHAAVGHVASLRSAILLQLGDTAGAVAAARRAIEFTAAQPDLPHELVVAWRNHLALALAEHGDLAAAATQYQTLLDEVREAGDTRARILLGRAALRQHAGNHRGAVADAQSARVMLERLAPWDEYYLLASYSHEAAAWTDLGACAAAGEVLRVGLEWADEAEAAEAHATLIEDRARWAARCRP